MKKKPISQPEHFRIVIHRDATRRFDLAAFADALVCLHGNAALDAALNLAHNINRAAHQCSVEQRLLEARADDLRSRLDAVEEQLRAVRD